MFDYHCAVCHRFGCVQEHKWCYMDDGVLIQTVLEGLEEMLRRAGHTRAPYPYHGINMPATQAQYMYPSMSNATTYPPAFNTEQSFAPNDMDALVGHMQNAYITPPAHPIDTWVAEGSVSSAAQDGLSSSFDMSVPWPAEGYTSAPQNAGCDEDVLCAGRHANLFEASLPSPASAPQSIPIPSISVVEHLEQGTYVPQQVVKGAPAGPIYFNGELGVSFGSLEALANGEEPAFDAAASIGVRASVRFEFPQFPGHSTQVRVRHGVGKGRGGRPITLREMGAMVFDELRKLMDHAEKRGDSLRHGESVVDIERVVLLRVEHISKGSIQPILGIRSKG